jgi:hypothetical protein
VNQKTKSSINIALTVITAGGWFFFVWGPQLYFSRKRKKELEKYLKSKEIELSSKVIQHRAIQESISNINGRIPNTGTCLEVPSVRLYESRQGKTFTETWGSINATTETGTVGIGTKIGGIGIGAAASKGHTKGSINSKSITHAGKDEMTLIDEGVLIIKVESLSIAGKQFSRTVKLEDILSLTASSNQILISASTSDKNLLIELDSEKASEYIAQIISLLRSHKEIERSSEEVAALIVEIQNRNSEDLAILEKEISEVSKLLYI